MKTSSKINVKDLMLVGAYAALYFILVAVGTLLSVLIFRNPNMAYAPHFSALLSGTVFMLSLHKISKFGAITLIGAVMALFFSSMGYFVHAFLMNLAIGIIADVIAKLGAYKHKVAQLIAFVVFSLGNATPIVFMWLMTEHFVQRLLDKGKDMAYVERVMIPFNVANVVQYFVLLVIAAIVGGLLGQYMMQRHFRKASR